MADGVLAEWKRAPLIAADIGHVPLPRDSGGNGMNRDTRFW
jgi:hypothetical protein